jgi:hypothetical protein
MNLTLKDNDFRDSKERRKFRAVKEIPEDEKLYIQVGKPRVYHGHPQHYP